MSKLASPKGTHDLLPPDITQWQHVESVVHQLLGQAAYQEIRTPIFEATELFHRGVGDTTDIVNKEMYTFEQGERSLTLRPENTASIVRAYLQHGLDRWPKPVKLFYVGPMFRYERPQKGRQRQFHQIGVEVFGLDTPATDAEVIAMAWDLLIALGIGPLQLELNNIGTTTERERFKAGLRELLRPHLEGLCTDCQQRFETNPLRLLDCKVETCQALFQTPALQQYIAEDFTDEATQAQFQETLNLLDRLSIPYRRNPMLVRGLDYYTKLVFEITSSHLGAQNAVCGGGRYNDLVQQLGGPAVPATGWAMGMERLISLMPPHPESRGGIFVASDDTAMALAIVRQIRHHGLKATCDLAGRKNLGKQLAQADKEGATVALVIGESERAAGNVVYKDLLNSQQETLSLQDALDRIQTQAPQPV